MSTWAMARAAGDMRSVLHDEGEPVLRRPGVVEALQPQLAPAGVGPQADDVPPAEGAEPGLVQEDDGPLALDVGVGDAEVEGVLVGRPGEPALRRHGDDVLERDRAIEFQEHDRAHAGGRRPIRGKVLRGHRGLGVPVAARRHQLLGGAAVTDGRGIDLRDEPQARARPISGATVVRASTTNAMWASRSTPSSSAPRYTSSRFTVRANPL